MRKNIFTLVAECAVLLLGGLAAADSPTEAADERKPEPAPVDWFVADPFPSLGYEPTFGDGCYFVQLASHGAFYGELKVTAEQHRVLNALRMAHEQLDTQKKQDLIREFGRLPSEEWTKWRKQNWDDARELAGALMGDAARQRVEQLLVQKQGMRAFTDPAMADKFGLSADQRAGVQKSIAEHVQRVKKLEEDLAAAQRAIDKPEAERAAESFRLRKAKNQAGVDSYRRNWEDVYHILTAEQRAQYLELRGRLMGK
jgi:hypothetical protein